MSAKVAIPVTIGAGTALSTIADIAGYDIVGVLFPAAWDAADITFQTGISNQAADMRNVMTDAATPLDVVVGADASLFVQMTDDKQRGWLRYVRIRSGTPGVPVNQTADRIVYLIGHSD